MVKPGSIDEYLASIPDDRRRALETLRGQVNALVSDAEECISYSMPAFRVRGQVVAGFLATAKGCSYYPHSGTTLDALAEELAGYSRTKSALHFDPAKGLPKALLRKLVEARLAEIAAATGPSRRGGARTPKAKPRARKRGVTADDVRAMALALEGVSEVPHMERTALRTKRKTFATLGEDGRVNLLVEPADRRDALLAELPGVVHPLGGWTRLGFIAVELARAERGWLEELVRDAWLEAQPVAKPPRKKR